MQDFLQWGALSKIVFAQLVNQPGKLVEMTLFMRSAVAGQMFASNMAMLFVYDILFRISRAVSPIHEKLLPPKLLYRWRRLVSTSTKLPSVTCARYDIVITGLVKSARWAENFLTSRLKPFVSHMQAEAFEYGSANDYTKAI